MIRITLSRLAGIGIMVWAFALPVFAQNSSSIATEKGLQNPLKFDNINDFIAGFLRAIVMIAIPLITIFVVYAGFKFISARGKPDSLNEAKKNFTYVILGAILILSAWVLATLIGGTVRQLLG
ncbi:MAG: hypothetical protein A2854_04980 [Parcubacteria group bacterium RIFCSPHIGHO2_01_FULL_56_18]|nr:MAG: hypothetical protein A2854_04980 [Parcubacteria group bacterium RIFCSPHIGHO2_01_FULL_56_18]